MKQKPVPDQQRTDSIVLTDSITGPPFFLACAPLALEKNEPKKLGSSFLASTSRSLLLLTCPGRSLPLFGSGVGGGGLFAFSRSWTIDMA